MPGPTSRHPRCLRRCPRRRGRRGSETASSTSALPGRDVGIFPAAAGLPVAPVREQVVALRVDIAGALIEVGPPPRIERYGLLEVRPAPAARLRIAGGPGTEGFEPLRARWVVVVVEAVGLEREAEQPDLRPRPRGPRGSPV